MSLKVAVTLLVMLISVVQPFSVLADHPTDQAPIPRSGPAPRTIQYVNFTDDTTNWQRNFYSVPWPTGPFSQVTLTYYLYNHGCTLVGYTYVGVNNVTLMFITTKMTLYGVENHTKDISLFQEVFSQQPNELEWVRPTNYSGGWGAKLSFAFYPGNPSMDVPKNLPAFFHTSINRSMDNMTNATVTFPPGTQRAIVVLTENPFSPDIFWFDGFDINVRDFQLMINNSTVFDITALPYFDSSMGLHGNFDQRLEWNATPPPGTGIRAEHFVNITPYAYMLNGTKKVTFAINEGQDTWVAGLSFLLYGPDPGAPFKYQNQVVSRKMTGPTQLLIFTSARSTRPVTNGQETLHVNYSSWLNTSTLFSEVHEILTVSNFISTPTLHIVMEKVEETFYNYTVDPNTNYAINFYYIRTWRNTTRVWGNDQDSATTYRYQDYELITAAVGGKMCNAFHTYTKQSLGNITYMGIQWNVTDTKYMNISGTNGLGTPGPLTSSHNLSGTPVPFPALFFISPAPENPVTGTTDIEFVYTNATLVSSSLDINGKNTVMTGKSGMNWDTSSLGNGPYYLKAIGLDNSGRAHVNIVRVYKGQRPTVVTSTPADKTDHVPVNAEVSVRFSMPMDKQGTQKALTVEPSVNGGSFTWNPAADTITWQHTALLRNDTRYNITIHGNATNYYGVQLWNDFKFSFNAWVPPSVVSVRPAPGAVNVSTNSTVTVRFSVPMNKTSAQSAFRIDPAVGNVSFAWDPAAKNMTWSHNDPFQRNQKYEVTVGKGTKARDGAPIGAEYRFNISTLNPPKVATVWPANNSTRIRLDAGLMINFTAPMDKTSVALGFNITPFVDGAFVWSPGSRSLSWNHTMRFLANTTYKVTIASGIKDFGGIAMEMPYTWSFRTAPPPFVMASEPTNGAKDVDLFEPIIIAFSEPVNTTSVENAFTLAPSIPGKFEWLNGQELTWTHKGDRFRAGTIYTLTLKATFTSVLNISASSDYSMTFTTAPRPTVLSTMPKDGAIEVPLSTNISVTFSLPMNRNSVEKVITYNTLDTSFAVIYKWSDERTLKVVPNAPLKSRTEYTITIGLKSDSSKNASLGTDISFSFKTGLPPDLTPPDIMSILPDNGTKSVSIMTVIVITFTEPMNRTSVEKALKVNSDGKLIAGTFVWNPTGDTVTFTPKERLPKGKTIIVYIDPSASDLAGNKMSSDRSYWYQTVSGAKPSNGTALLVAAGLAVVIIVVAIAIILMTMRKGTKEMKKGPPRKGGPKKVIDKKK